jgi:hypothetical protein
MVMNTFTADAFSRARLIATVAKADVLIFLAFHEYLLLNLTNKRFNV